MIKFCEECGAEYQARTSKQRFCKGPHYTTCAICGELFQYTCSPADKPHTCGKVCKQKYKEAQLLKKYGVINVSQIAEVREKKKISNASEAAQEKSRKTCLARYGVEHANQSDEVRAKLSKIQLSPETKERRRQTFQAHYGVDHVFMSPEYRETYGCNTISTKESTKRTIRRKLMEKYGVTSVSHIPEVIHKAQLTREANCLQKYGENCIFKTAQFKQHMQDTYGVDNIAKHPDTLRKAMRNKQKKSSLEIRLHNFLATYDIEYIEEYPISDGSLTHSFDVYLPKYKILIDVDGIYWHSYLSDPDGYRVRDDGDEVRLALLPEDHIFYLIVESDFERGLRGLQKMITELDSNLFDYNSHLFEWCRSVGFPYFNYDDERLHKEWARLQSYVVDKYNVNCRFGISIVNHFHRSIFDAHTNNSPSPRQAWEDDKLLKKVIANRLIYQNDVTPSKVLKGFNISKIAPKVSVFNPVLALYICQKYLADYRQIFDPFSGFSGRLLGVCASNKEYVGQDIDATHVSESNEIINYFHLTAATVSVQDIETCCNGQYDALLTCPPYNNKEIYGSETVFNSCDDWIDICLDRFNCRRYVFVVDDTVRYTDNIVEILPIKSHFSNTSEKLIVIDR